MLERLFRKKSLLSYIPILLSAFSSMIIGINPFSNALFVAQVEEKIPIIITFAFTCIVQFLMFGMTAVLRYLTFVIIYSIIVSFGKTKSSDAKDTFSFLKVFLPRILIALVISEVLLFWIKVEDTTKIPEIICLCIFTIFFSLIFKYAFKYLFSVSINKENVNYFDAICFVILCIVSTSILRLVPILGTNLWMFLSILAFMLVVWKKNIVFAIVLSLLTAITIIICDLNMFSIGFILLCLIVGIATSIFSKANKKGALIGLIVSFVVLFATSINSIGKSTDPAMSPRLQDDYLNYMKQSAKLKSGDELEKINEEIARIEEYKNIEESAKNTVSSTIMKCMLLGFLIICLMPDKLLEQINGKIPDAPSVKTIRERWFKIQKIYLLDSGKEEYEEEKK